MPVDGLAALFAAFPGTTICCTKHTVTRPRLSPRCDNCLAWVWNYRKDGAGFCFNCWQVEGKKANRQEARAKKAARAKAKADFSQSLW